MAAHAHCWQITNGWNVHERGPSDGLLSFGPEVIFFHIIFISLTQCLDTTTSKHVDHQPTTINVASLLPLPSMAAHARCRQTSNGRNVHERGPSDDLLSFGAEVMFSFHIILILLTKCLDTTLTHRNVSIITLSTSGTTTLTCQRVLNPVFLFLFPCFTNDIFK